MKDTVIGYIVFDDNALLLSDCYGPSILLNGKHTSIFKTKKDAAAAIKRTSKFYNDHLSNYRIIAVKEART